MVEINTEVLDVIKRTPTVKSLRLKARDSKFKPGQFFFVTIDVEGEKRTKHFSFSNSPTEKEYIEFTKRITESPFSKALDKLKKGNEAHLKMPYGSFTFEGEYEKIAFLSGGIGITPIRSMCKFAADKGLSTDIILLYSNRSEGEIVFKSDFDDIQAINKNMRAVHVVGSRIDENLIKKEIPDFKNRVFYTCGPPAMVDGMTDILKDKLGVDKNSVKTENFTGGSYV